MISEGIGVKPPAAVQRKMSMPELLQVLSTSKERAEFRAYKSRSDLWGQGCKSSTTVPGIGRLSQDVRPIYCGVLGEYAAKDYIAARFPGTVELDTALHAQGDFGIDLVAFGMKMQVKTRQNERRENLVRRVNGNGRVMSVPSHTFLFCEWTGHAVIYLLGWCWAQLVLSKPLTDSVVGDWKNAVIDDCELNPMSSLRDELDAWRAARCL